MRPQAPAGVRPGRAPTSLTRPRTQRAAAGSPLVDFSPRAAPPPPSTSRPGPPPASDSLSTLLRLAAATDRGVAASRSERAAADVAVAALEAAQDPSADLPTLTAGDWLLVYTTAQPFRSSPFFWCFQAAVGSAAAAEAIFAFTALAPLATVGAARQTVRAGSVGSPARAGSIVSRVRLTVAGVGGDVVSEATTAGAAPGELVVTVTTTRVEGSSIPGVAGTVVDVARGLAAARRGSPATARLRTTYCDGAVRVTRTLEDDHAFVYVREQGGGGV